MPTVCGKKFRMFALSVTTANSSPLGHVLPASNATLFEATVFSLYHPVGLEVVRNSSSVMSLDSNRVPWSV